MTIYFDGSCPLCTAEIGLYARQQGAAHLAFVNVAEPGAAAAAGLDPDKALARFHVRDAQGRLVTGARAFATVWDQLPSWRWAARVAHLPGALVLLEGAYRLFLPIRPTLARFVTRLTKRRAP